MHALLFTHDQLDFSLYIIIIFNFKNALFYTSLCVPVRVSVYHTYAGADEDQERDSDSLELELQGL